MALVIRIEGGRSSHTESDMASTRASAVIQRFHSAGLTDGQLLADYLGRRDDDALGALVRRHGPMVWGVCRRVLRNHHDAEDAFQATFLVLVRKAASIATRDLLANWLYKVAYHTALNARAAAARRNVRGTPVIDMPEPEAAEPDVWRDLLPLLDRELCRLPDKYRVAIILCDLEGKTRTEAARQLGCPEGTVAGRLARGRVMLARRLARYGPALSGGVLAAALAHSAASANVPPTVLSSTIKATSLFATGRAAAAGAVSAKVAALTDGVLKTMLLTKLKLASAVVVTIVVLAAVASLVKLPAPAAEPPAPKTESPAARATPKQAPKTGRLLVWKGDGFVFVSPGGSEGERVSGQVDQLMLNEPVLSPNGKRVAFTVTDEPKLDDQGFRRRKLFVRELDGKDAGRTFAFIALNLFWSPDSRGLYTVWSKRGKEPKDVTLRLTLIDTMTGETTPVELPQSVHPFAITPDGKAFVVAAYDHTVRPRTIHLSLLPLGG